MNKHTTQAARFTGECICGQHLDIAYIQPHGAFWNCQQCFPIYQKAKGKTRTQFLKNFIQQRKAVNDHDGATYAQTILNNTEELTP